MIPDWLAWSVTFASGVAGVFAGLKVGIARLEANYSGLRQQMDEARATLRYQVGEARCDRYREDCQNRIEKRLDNIERLIEGNRNHVSSKFEEIAVYMAKHNGD
jgi:hypothetical protein